MFSPVFVAYKQRLQNFTRVIQNVLQTDYNSSAVIFVSEFIAAFFESVHDDRQIETKWPGRWPTDRADNVGCICGQSYAIRNRWV